uniref:Ovalbumin-related protein X-like n=1 Tax=Drosophila rhopaloa TaxID=1041015 RepID=A0A6P4EBU7_DRORH
MKFFWVVLLVTSVLGQFTKNLYQFLILNHDNTNVIASPLCVEIGLSMILMGAEGKTARELRRALVLPQDKKEVASIYDELLTYLEKRKNVAMLLMANRLFVNESFRINKEYNEQVKKSFRAEAEAINLADQTKAAYAISDWVLDQTLDNIKGVVLPRNLAPNESVVLVNVAFLKGYWKTRFERKNTELVRFGISEHKRVLVKMMSQVSRFRMNNLTYGQIIELPFAYSNLSMIIGLPRHIKWLRWVEKKLEVYSESMEEVLVHVQLPKFRIEFRTELVGILKRMGIRDLFTDSSNLGALLEEPGARISQIIHKAFIEINEEGASAGGASGGSDPPDSFFLRSTKLVSNNPDDWQSFKASHPFAFVIRDKKTIYFRGRVFDPEMNSAIKI